jgi:hypothetical protein
VCSDKSKAKEAIEYFKEARTNMWHLMKEYGLDTVSNSSPAAATSVNSNLGEETKVNPKKEKVTDAVLA